MMRTVPRVAEKILNSYLKMVTNKMIFIVMMNRFAERMMQKRICLIMKLPMPREIMNHILREKRHQVRLDQETETTEVIPVRPEGLI